MYKKIEVGKNGEKIATQFLKNLGYEILVKNFKCKIGEIDIIAKDKEEIVFIEVKTRKVLNCGLPSEAVDENKQKHFYKSAEFFLYKHNLMNSFCRFDVIEVYLLKKSTRVVHLKSVEIYQKD